MILAEAAYTAENLAQAWAEVRQSDLADGVESATVARFAEDAEEQLQRLRLALTSGAYETRALIEVVIPGGSHDRRLAVPPATDRVVARALLTVLTPLVDPWLGPSSFAYRPGLGVADAVAAVAALRDEGLNHVLRADVHDCFPSIDARDAHRRLADLLPDDSLTPVLEQLQQRLVLLSGGRLRAEPGLPQGCALSPLLCNLVLRELDEALRREGFPIVRYADDFVVATTGATEAWQAARVAARNLEEMGMTLSDEKTQVTSFEEGFTFLGEDFGPRYPPSLTTAGLDAPEHKVLYVGAQGSRVRVRSGRVLVESKNDAELLSVPTSHVLRIVLLGSVGLSAGARAWALSSGVPVILASRNGSYQGTLVSHAQRHRTQRLRAQISFTDTSQATDLARHLVASKINLQRVLLQRFGRREHQETVADALSALAGYRDLLGQAQSVSELMGVEGAAAAAYFPAFGALFPQELRFTVRSRRPPQDAANAALSFLYTVLLGECVTALYAAGLDPGFGVLHTEQEKRPSLALDLMEELRPLIVDQAVLDAARQARFRPEHAYRKEGSGVWLTKAGRQVILEAYERRMNTRTRGAIPDFAGSWRRHLHRQAQRLAATITGSDHPWKGLSWR